MRFPQPPLHDGDKESFIDLWSQHYRDSNEHLYLENIEKKKTEDVIIKLFIWKNGSVMSKLKHERVLKHYKPGDQSHLELDSPDKIAEYAAKDAAVIWNIFWLHCLAPTIFPIYDQHAHRAMMFMMGYNEGLEVPTNKRALGECYANQFMPFFSELVGPNPSISSARRVDGSLFAFGKFLKSIDTRLW